MGMGEGQEESTMIILVLTGQHRIVKLGKRIVKLGGRIFHKLRSHVKAIWTHLDAIRKSLDAMSMFSIDEMTSSSSDTACLPQIHGPWLRGLSQAPKHKTTRGLPTCSTRPMTVLDRAE